MKIASLDLGSNSFLLMIAKKGQKGLVVLHDECVITRLGQGVHKNRRFHEEALQRVELCFQQFQKTIIDHQVDKVVAVSTSAARDVQNKDALINLGKKYGIEIKIIDGPEEARLTFLGATYDLPIQKKQERFAVLDVGGGSTEILSQDINGRAQGLSLDIGSVRLTEMFITRHPISQEELQSVRDYIRQKLQETKSQRPQKIQRFVAVAGTPTTIACMIIGKPYDQEVHGQVLYLSDLQTWQSKLADMTVVERENLIGMQPGRADVIVAGLTILIEMLMAYQVDRLQVSIKGVRFGLALEA